MSRVLIVKGTSDLDVYDLGLALEKKGIEFVYCHWYELADSVCCYDLAVLFGLDDRHKNRADLFAGTVRKAIGPDTKFLIVSKWDRLLINAEQMKQKYNAEYFSRHGPIPHLLDKVLGMMPQAKTAP